MAWFGLHLILFTSLVGLPLWAGEFRIALNSEISALDPLLSSSSDGGYLFGALYTRLYRLRSDGRLELDQAQSCQRKRRALSCRLRENLKWSDGSELTAADYARTFERIRHSQRAARKLHLLSRLKSVRAVGPRQIEFRFAPDDLEFEMKLAAIGTEPTPLATKAGLTNGPYQVARWVGSQRLELKANPYFHRPAKAPRPSVSFLFIARPEIALKLFDAHQLELVTRVPSSLIGLFRGRKDFVQVPTLRFDYLGFSTRLNDRPKLRQALSESIDFIEMQRLFQSPGRPGCPSFNDSYTGGAVCLNFAPERALAALGEGGGPMRSWPWRLHYSASGGDDFRRAFEWTQSQWQKHLGLFVDVQADEPKVFMARLRQNQALIFRKGVALDRPSCLAALEVFLRGHPENYLEYDDLEYAQTLTKMSETKPRTQAYTALCRRAVTRLLSSNRLIPLGQFYFSMLASQQFSGWEINEMNQLDLSDLRARP